MKPEKTTPISGSPDRCLPALNNPTNHHPPALPSAVLPQTSTLSATVQSAKKHPRTELDAREKNSRSKLTHELARSCAPMSCALADETSERPQQAGRSALANKSHAQALTCSDSRLGMNEDEAEDNHKPAAKKSSSPTLAKQLVNAGPSLAYQKLSDLSQPSVLGVARLPSTEHEPEAENDPKGIRLDNDRHQQWTDSFDNTNENYEWAYNSYAIKLLRAPTIGEFPVPRLRGDIRENSQEKRAPIPTRPSTLNQSQNAAINRQQAEKRPRINPGIGPIFKHPAIAPHLQQATPQANGQFNLDHLKELIAQDKIDYRKFDSNQDDVFRVAIRSGSFEAVKLLIDGSKTTANPKNFITKTNKTGLAQRGKIESNMSLCVEHNNQKMLSLLINEGFHINIVDGTPPYDWPLTKAAKLGFTESIKILRNQKSLKLNVTDINGRCPLMLAARGGHLEALKELTKNMPRNYLLATARDGKTALDYARENNHTHVVRYLKEEISNLKPSFSYSSPHDYFRRGVNWQDQAGRTCLMFASKMEWVNMMRSCINQGASLDAADKNGNTALHYAIRDGMHWNRRTTTASAEVLLAAGANPNKINKNQQTPLTRALRNSHFSSVEHLLRNKADVRLSVNNEESATQIATRQLGWYQYSPKAITAYKMVLLYDSRYKIFDAKRKNMG